MSWQTHDCCDMSWQAHRIVVTWEILIKKKQALLYVELYAHKKHLIICNMAKCITEKFRKFIYSHTVLKLFLKMSRRVTYNIIHNCLLYTNIYGKCKMYWYIHTVYKTQTFNSLISLLAILYWYIHTVYKIQTFNSLISLLAILYQYNIARREIRLLKVCVLYTVCMFRYKIARREIRMLKVCVLYTVCMFRYKIARREIRMLKVCVLYTV